MARSKEQVEDKRLHGDAANKAANPESTKGTTRRCSCSNPLSLEAASHAPSCLARVDLGGTRTR
jgi:hypothetical protein